MSPQFHNIQASNKEQHTFMLNLVFNTKLHFFISRRALAWEGDYEMMPVCVCVCACVHALVCHADFSKTTTATDFL